MSTVTFDRATRVYPGLARPAVDHLELEVADGEFLVLVGPSGCGKSTTLRMLAGLEPVDDGTILIGDRDVTMLPPKDRDIAMVFQNYALYPHMTVAENIGFHLKITKVGKAEIDERVREAAKLLDLEEYLNRKPSKLSGGQRQRVAMGRAIVRQPQVFLMDEPLSNLDAKLRVSDAHADRHVAAPPRGHDRVRHPRPDRSHDDGRPRRGAERRHPPAVRHPA
jgi:multiple sugar transport system ATP-binding protein